MFVYISSCCDSTAMAMRVFLRGFAYLYLGERLEDLYALARYRTSVRSPLGLLED